MKLSKSEARYVFSQSVRGGNAELKKYVLDPVGYDQVNSDFKKKSRQFTRKVEFDENGKLTDRTASYLCVLFKRETGISLTGYINREKLEEAKRLLRDTDMPKEMMNLTAANVLQQAGVSMLSQANQSPQSILTLLR